MNIIPIILCGGFGKRIWPLSNHFKAKPFVSPDNQDNLLRRTLYRSLKFEVRDIIIISNSEFESNTVETVKSQDLFNSQVHLLFEPESKNTYAAIGFAASYAKKKIDPEAVLLVMPSDHIIRNLNSFIENVHSAARELTEDNMFLLGMQPKFPDTSYGYIECDEPLNTGKSTYKAMKFTEKPNFNKAREYINQGSYMWNMGIFILKVQALEKIISELYPQDKSLFFDCDFQDHDSNIQHNVTSCSIPLEAMRSLPSNSFDYAVAEKWKNIGIYRADFFWKDLGSWRSIYELNSKDKNGNVKIGNCFTINSRNNLIWNSGKPCAVIGVDNLVIVETTESILITNKNETEAIANAYDKYEVELDTRNFIRNLFSRKNTHIDILQVSHGKETKVFFTPETKQRFILVMEGNVDLYSHDQLVNNFKSGQFIPEEFTNHEIMIKNTTPQTALVLKVSF